MSQPARPPRGWAPVVAVAVALLVVTLVNLIADRLGSSVNWPVSLGTAAIVGAFLGLSLLRPKRPDDAFTVED